MNRITENRKTVLAITFATVFTVSLMFAQSSTMVFAAHGGPHCDGPAANIFKKFPGDDTSNTFVVDGVDVEMVRWDKDVSGTIEATEGWIIKGTGNKKLPLDDVVVGTDKDDLIKPGWGNDRVCAGAGDDRLQGGWGADRLFGEAGNDLLKGGWGGDLLVGGADTDEAQGGKNFDTCTAETVSSCEA